MLNTFQVFNSYMWFKTSVNKCMKASYGGLKSYYLIISNTESLVYISLGTSNIQKQDLFSSKIKLLWFWSMMSCKDTNANQIFSIRRYFCAHINVRKIKTISESSTKRLLHESLVMSLEIKCHKKCHGKQYVP